MTLHLQCRRRFVPAISGKPDPTLGVFKTAREAEVVAAAQLPPAQWEQAGAVPCRLALPR